MALQEYVDAAKFGGGCITVVAVFCTLNCERHRFLSPKAPNPNSGKEDDYGDVS